MSNAADMSGHEGFEKTAEDKTNVQGDDRKPSRRNRGGVRGQQPLNAGHVLHGAQGDRRVRWSQLRKGGRPAELFDRDGHPGLQEPPSLTQMPVLGNKDVRVAAQGVRGKTIRREEQLQRIFALILGQCSQTLRDRLEAGPSWKKINADSDVVGLLKNIRSQLMKAKALLRCQDLMDVFEAAGGHIGRTASSFLKNSSSPPSSSEVEEARSLALEEYGALAMIT
ncbi:hypothetical protein IV203_020488, partial [Nitzschia inconspicua]